MRALRALRQASEQYFTSCQFLAHDFLQVMGRWHTQHSLVGSDCLLPLKASERSGFMETCRCKGQDDKVDQVEYQIIIAPKPHHHPYDHRI